jgi:hypothetical protein
MLHTPVYFRDKGTGKEQQIVIQSSGGLSKVYFLPLNWALCSSGITWLAFFVLYCILPARLLIVMPPFLSSFY